MSAVFNYSKEYVLWNMTLLEVYTYIDYIAENPPAGRIIKVIAEAFGGDKSKNNTTKKPVFKTEAERKNYEKQQLRNMLSDFGGDINNLPKKPKRKMADLSKYERKEGLNG